MSGSSERGIEEECATHIEQVRVDMRPRGLRP